MPGWVYEMTTNPTFGDFFMFSLPATFVERVFFTVIATVVCVAVIMAVGKSFLHI